MSEHPPDLTPEQETRLRRLLAAARHDVPMPDDIAARLDRVLLQLHEQDDDRSDDAPPAPADLASVVELRGRRRRIAAGLLLAAAAVVVAGVSIGHHASSGDDASATASDPAAAAVTTEARIASGDGSRKSAPGATVGGAVGDSGDSSVGGATSGAPADGIGGTFSSATGSGPIAVPPLPEAGSTPSITLRHATFARQVRHIQTSRMRLFSENLASPTQAAPPTNGLDYAMAPICGGRFGPGRRVSVTYDGVPAALVFRPASADAQVVDLFRCGSTEVIRTTTLPAP